MFQVPFTRSFKQNWLGEIKDSKAILLVLIAGAIVYYFAIHRRR